MKILDVQQRSQEWIELRKSCVTATDFAVIAANNKLSDNIFHKTIKSTIQSKFNPKKTSVYLQKIFDIGHDLEPKIIDALNFPDVVTGEVILSDDNNNIMCSLDARDKMLDMIIEIKTTADINHGIINKFNYYQYQVLHQCYVTGVKNGVIIIADYDESGIRNITRRYIEAEKLLSYSMWLELCNKFLIELEEYKNKLFNGGV